MPESVELFISYTHKDEIFRDELAKHLSALRYQKVIADWHDRKIIAGQDWSHEISANLEAAAVVLLLVSPDFLASGYCWDVELKRAIEKHDRGEAIVIPVFIRPVDFEGAPFARLQGLPKDAKPISTWPNHDEAWVDVVRGIRKAVERLRNAAPAPKSVPAVIPRGSENSSSSRGGIKVQLPLPQSPAASPRAMSSYGDVAILATKLYRDGGYASPRVAWHEAAHRLLQTRSLREKNCPRATFLSICQEGWIPGIPPGEYTQSKENRAYALAAVHRLEADPSLADARPEDLWRLVLGRGQKQYNQQMDVVQALWRGGLIHVGTARDDDEPEPAEQGMLGWLGVEGERLVDAFTRVFGERMRPFGNRARSIGGLSDGNEGVQWNVGYDPRDESCWIGVNLEGIEYREWPVARLIRREMHAPTLPALIRTLRSIDKVEIQWKQDYWQAASRPEIKERFIAPTPIAAGQLTESLWLEALKGAGACLASPTGRRASREVTLAKAGTRVIGPVSPHLTILLPAPAPGSWRDFLAGGKRRLQPFHDWAVEQAA